MQNVTASTAKLLAVQKALWMLSFNSCSMIILHTETGISKMIQKDLNEKHIFIKENAILIKRIKKQISEQPGKTMTWVCKPWMCKLPLLVKREWEKQSEEIIRNN